MNGLANNNSNIPAGNSSAEKAKKRTSHRDAIIRKKFEQQSTLPLPSGQNRTPGSPSSSPVTSRRQSVPNQHQHNTASDSTGSLVVSVKPGTVAAMRPASPIVVSEGTSVTEVARTMAGRRADAILITDEKGSGQLRGIVTDKDLAFRCIADGLDASRTKVYQIMTRDPVYVSSDAPVDVAINKMLKGHFRHLPVVDHNRIVGLLDVTKVLIHIQSKIQNSWGKASALKSAFHEFQTSWQNFAATPEVQGWFEEWSEKMVEPNLLQVMNINCPLPEVGLKSTVREAAKVMKDTRQTAVLVYDNSHELAGIFTTKDICLRVLAPNDCDPRSTSVVRVMTPHPDCVGEDTTVRHALKKMNDGHYLHLPVREAAGNRIIGLVDVLTLTYSTMEQLATQQSMTLSPLFSDGSAMMDRSLIEQQQHHHQQSQQQNAGPWSKFFETTEMYQNSMTEESRQKGGMTGDLASVDTPSVNGSQSATTVVPGMVNGTAFVFKFRDPLTGIAHRFTSRATAGEFGESPFAELLETIVQKCGCEITLDERVLAGTALDLDPETLLRAGNISSALTRDQAIAKQYQLNYFIKTRPVVAPVIVNQAQPCDQSSADETFYLFRIFYKDDEGDLISINGDSDLLDAINIARTMGWGRIFLKLEIVLDANGRQYPINELASNPSVEDDEDLRSLTSLTTAGIRKELTGGRSSAMGSFFENPLLWGAGIGIATVGIVAVVALIIGRTK